METAPSGTVPAFVSVRVCAYASGEQLTGWVRLRQHERKVPSYGHSWKSRPGHARRHHAKAAHGEARCLTSCEPSAKKGKERARTMMDTRILGVSVEARVASPSKARSGRVRVLAVFGTRPEAIKMAPVITAARAHHHVDLHVCVTGQHRQMLDETMRAFGLQADSDLDIMRPDQGLGDITIGAIRGLQETLTRHPCDWLLVQGDTTSAFAASLAAFYAKTKVAHVEAGLRTGDKMQPWPEEANRRLVSVLTDRHYAPTVQARDNLLRENIPAKDIIVTGNTVIDALLEVSARLDSEPALQSRLERQFDWLDVSKRLILVTGHRRESFGEGFQNICDALRQLALRDDVQVIYPVHLNPNVRGPVFGRLSDLDNVRLIEPVDYVSLVHLLKRCHFVLTDSGGIQEEAPSLHKPVLVMRATSERMEAVDLGVAKLVGTDPARIVAEAVKLLDDASAHSAMSVGANPFGDGRAAHRIIEDLLS